MADLATQPHPSQVRNVVLIIEDDEDIGNLLEELLTDEGYAVALLRSREAESIADAVERIGPDCVLLDGCLPGNYDRSWADAAWMRAQEAAVPVIMFSADGAATAEARMNVSGRSQAAGFSSVLSKPFELDDLLRVIGEAVSQSPSRSGA